MYLINNGVRTLQNIARGCAHKYFDCNNTRAPLIELHNVNFYCYDRNIGSGGSYIHTTIHTYCMCIMLLRTNTGLTESRTIRRHKTPFLSIVVQATVPRRASLNTHFIVVPSTRATSVATDLSTYCEYCLTLKEAVKLACETNTICVAQHKARIRQRNVQSHGIHKIYLVQKVSNDNSIPCATLTSKQNVTSILRSFFFPPDARTVTTGEPPRPPARSHSGRRGI